MHAQPLAAAAAGERYAKRARLTDDPEPPPDDWRAVFAASAVVPVSAEGVRAFTEPSALARGEELLAAAAEAWSEAGSAYASGALRLTIHGQRESASTPAATAVSCVRTLQLRIAAHFGGGAEEAQSDEACALVQASLTESEAGGSRALVCTAVTCTGAACRESLGLCPHAAACLLRLAAAPSLPDLLDVDDQEDRRLPGDFREVLQTTQPHFAALDYHGCEICLHPIEGAPQSQEPLFYSRTCGHQLFLEDKIADGGDPACFNAVFNRLRAFSEQLRAAGQLLPAAGVLLRLAASLAEFKGDERLLWRYELSGADTKLVNSREFQQRRPQANACADHAAECLSSLCLIAIDERVSAQQRTLLATAALEIVDSFGLRRDIVDAADSELRFADDPSLCDLNGSSHWGDGVRTVVLRQAARTVVRAARMTRTTWDHPALRAALAEPSPSASLELLRLELPLDLKMRCRYLLERGRAQEHLNLSRAGVFFETLVGRPGDAGAVAAVLELVDKHLPLLFDADRPNLAIVGGSGLLCDRECTQLASSTAGLHSPLCTRRRCRSVWQSSGRLRIPLEGSDWRQRQRVVMILDSAINIAKTVEALQQQLAAAGDHLSVLWLSLALITLGRDEIPDIYLSSPKEVNLVQLLIRSGLALRSTSSSPTSPPPPSPERESAEALRVAGLPLADAFAACAQRPDVALEAALVRLARTGSLPYKYFHQDCYVLLSASLRIDGKAESPAPQFWCTPLQEAGLGALSTRFFLHNANLATACSMSGRYDRDGPEPHDSYLSRIGDALFGPFSAEPAAMASPAHVLDVAVSLLAARRGAALSVLGECQPALPQQYETLLLSCALRLDALDRFDDALRLVSALLEMASESSDAGADARRKLCLDLLVKTDIFNGPPFKRLLSIFDDFDRLSARDNRPALVGAVGLDAIRAFLDSKAAAWAFSNADNTFSLQFVNCVLRSHLAGHGGSTLCENSTVFGDASQERRLTTEAVEALLDVSRQQEGESTDSVPGYLARVVLQQMSKVGRTLSLPCEEDQVDLILRYSVLLDQNGDVEGAAGLAFSAIIRCSEWPHFTYALRHLDIAAPRLAELWGVSSGGVGFATLRRRLFGRFLDRFTDLQTPCQPRDRIPEPWALSKSFAEKVVGMGRVDPPLVDYFLAAKIGVAAFANCSVRLRARNEPEWHSSFDLGCPPLWRRVLGELDVILRSEDAVAEEDRADALRLAELVWDACPCVQAVWVMQSALASGDDDSEDRYESWLKSILKKLNQNVHLIFAGELPSECQPRCNLRVSGEAAFTARLVLAAGALLFATEVTDSEGRARVEAALGLDASSSPAGGVSSLMLLARWCKLAHAAYFEFAGDMPPLFDPDHDDLAGDLAFVWHGSADMDGPVKVLQLYMFYITAVAGPESEFEARRFGPGPGPAPGDGAHASEDRYTVEQLAALGRRILSHQREAIEGEYCEDPGCRLCRGAGWWPWRCARGNLVLFSPELLGDPMARLTTDIALHFPWGEDERAEMAHRMGVAYAIAKATAVAEAVRARGAGGMPESEREALVQSARKAYIAARIVTQELKLVFPALTRPEFRSEHSFEVRVVPALRRLEIFSSFLPADPAAPAPTVDIDAPAAAAPAALGSGGAP
eukprot:tig00000451_g968.t2